MQRVQDPSQPTSFDPCRIHMVDGLMFVFYSLEGSLDYDSYSVYLYDAEYDKFQSYNGELTYYDLYEAGLIAEEEYNTLLKQDEDRMAERLLQMNMDALRHWVSKYPVEAKQLVQEMDETV